MPEAKMVDTLVSLRQLIDDNDRRINDLLAEKEHRINGLMQERDLRFQQRVEATTTEARVAAQVAKEAVDKAESGIERRFSIANEWRASINDVITTRLSRDEYLTAHRAMVDKIDAATARLLTIEGRSNGIGVSLGVILSVGALLISLIIGSVGMLNYLRDQPKTPQPMVQQVIPHETSPR
jgi:hypothetical protein